MFDTVLLPIDVNHPSSWEKALPVAAHMAGPEGTIHILGIVHDVGAALVADYLPRDFEARVLQHMEAELETFCATHIPEGARAKPLVGHGTIPETILRMAGKVGADAIIMASHPPDELRHLLVGSYADRVVRHAPIPVMVVR